MRALTMLLFWLLGAAGSPAHAQSPAIGAETADEQIVARAGALELRWKELDELLLDRHARSDSGKESLRHLAETRLVETAAKETGIAVTAAQVEARVQQIAERIQKESGQTLEQHCKGARVTLTEFRYLLEVGMLQEELTRRALGLAPDAEVAPDAVKLWAQEAFTEREYKEFAPPWDESVVARGTGFSISVRDFVLYLRRRLTPEELRTDCYQFLLCRRVRARMPDASPAKVDEYVAREIERRRREAALDPRNKGLSYEKLLAAQGLRIEALARDPGVIVSALSKLWIDRAYDAEALKRSYQDERAYYDDMFGEAIDVSLLFLRAAQFKNELTPRTFPEAETALKRLTAGTKSAADFQKIAKQNSEDGATREAGGALGWVTAGSRSAPPEVRAEIKQRLAAQATPAQIAGEGLVGPLRTPTGCVLLWLGPRRPAPPWETMAGYVQRELRRRFLEEALPHDSVTYNLDN
jgi:transcriptional regulator with XRE-family HTH domain